MQLIVTCAGCGAKYRGESGPKKFRCAACSNLFTFPDQPKAASTGTILCSNCWTETVPTEKLKTCGFCSQRVSPRYGGLAAEDKQVKVKQPSVRNDPNLVKAVTHPSQSSGEISANVTGSVTGPKSNQFVSSEWKEIGGEIKPDLPDPKKTQAFDIMAELKKEIEPEMQGVVESMMKSEDEKLQREQSGVGHSVTSSTPTHGTSPVADEPLTPRATQSVAPLASVPTVDAHESNAKLTALEAQLNTEKLAREKWLGERHALEVKLSDLESRLAQSASQRAGGADLQAKVADLTAAAAVDKRAKDQLMQERMQLEELWRERDSKVAELSARLNSDASSRAALGIERDELREFKRMHETKNTEFDAHLNNERQARESLQQEHDRLHAAHTEMTSKFAEMSAQSEIPGARTAMADVDEARQELETRIADLETRLGNEKKSKELLIKERDVLSDKDRELKARIADLESRLNSERHEKENVSKKHDEHLAARNELDAKVAQLDSRLTSEREAKEAAALERDKLHEIRLELEARTADLTRRHSTEKDAKERLLKEHQELGKEHRDGVAKIADFKTRLGAEENTRALVLQERDDALLRADAAEARVDKSEAEVARLRKAITAQLEKFGAEYNSILGQLAQKTSDLVAHAALTRKRLDEAVLHHGDKIENAASELKTKLDQESIEIGAKLKRMMQEHETRDSARLAAQSGTLASPPPSPSGSGVNGTTTANMPSAASGRYNAQQGGPAVNEESGSQRASLQDPAGSGGEHSSSSSARNAVIAENGVGPDGMDKNSGTFWAKVFKRPQTKV